jgi:hypothetical protein
VWDLKDLAETVFVAAFALASSLSSDEYVIRGKTGVERSYTALAGKSVRGADGKNSRKRTTETDGTGGKKKG